MTTIKNIVSRAARAVRRLATVATAAAAVAALPTAPALAGGYYFVQGSPTLVVNSIGANTNYAPAAVSTNLTWPASLPGGVSITNVTAINVANSRSIAFQMNCQITASDAASVTNVIFQIGRSVQTPNSMPAGGITNGFGNGLNIEWFATITNQLPASAAANTTYTSHALFGPQLGYSSGAFEDAMTTYYIGYIQPPANLTVTNYQVWVNTSP